MTFDPNFVSSLNGKESYIGKLLCHANSKRGRPKFGGQPVMYLKSYWDDDGAGFDAWFLVGEKIEKIHIWTGDFYNEWEFAEIIYNRLKTTSE